MKLFDSAIGKTVTTRPKRFRALASRCGVFPYLINGKLIWQYRPEEEVFNQDSIDSLLDTSITIGHPENDEELSESHGTVYSVEPVQNNSQNDSIENGIYADFLVFTDEARELSSSGIPTSPMYEVVLVEKQGDFEGKTYDYIQTNIRYTSLGLVSKARQEKTKVYYQLSKDSGLLLPDNNLENNLLEIPIISEKLFDETMPTKLANPLVSVIQKDEGKIETQETVDSVSLPLETNVSSEDNTKENTEVAPIQEDNKIEEPANQAVETSNETSPSNPKEKPAIAELNTSGGVNIQKDYLDDAIDVAKRASDMGLLSFNEAMQYSLSSMDVLMRMILLKEGVELDDWDDACAAYKVYCALRPDTNSSNTPSMTTTNSDSIENNTRIAQPKPLAPPKINHPLHQKPIVIPSSVEPLVTFDDYE